MRKKSTLSSRFFIHFIHFPILCSSMASLVQYSFLFTGLSYLSQLSNLPLSSAIIMSSFPIYYTSLALLFTGTTCCINTVDITSLLQRNMHLGHMKTMLGNEWIYMEMQPLFFSILTQKICIWLKIQQQVSRGECSDENEDNVAKSLEWGVKWLQKFFGENSFRNKKKYKKLINKSEQEIMNWHNAR